MLDTTLYILFGGLLAVQLAFVASASCNFRRLTARIETLEQRHMGNGFIP
jgi:hypothetical protein